ncbi:hypothetical protein ACOTJD_13815 [Achromobacter xylosoxidans]
MFNPLDNRACRYRMVGCRLGASATLLALLLPAAGQAQPTLWRPMGEHYQPGAHAIAPAPPAAPVSRLVKEILELDARRALLIEQRESMSAASLATVTGTAGQTTAAVSEQPPADAADQPAPQLQAIVGVGHTLSAVVVRANQRWVFQTGRPSPIAGPDSYLRLVRIETPCAIFRNAPQASVRTPLTTEPGTDVEHASQQTLCLRHVPP